MDAENSQSESGGFESIMEKIYVSQTAIAIGVLVGVVMVLIQIMLGVLLQTREVDTHLANSNCMEAFKSRGVTLPKGINFSMPDVITYPASETPREAPLNDTDIPP